MDTLEECMAAHRTAQAREGIHAAQELGVLAHNEGEYPRLVGMYSETLGLREWLPRPLQTKYLSEYERLEGRLHREGQALGHVQIGWHKTPCTRPLPGSPVVLRCLKANGEPRDFLLCWESGSEDLKREKTTCHTRGI